MTPGIGVTEQGYFRHLALGNNHLIVDGHGTGQWYATYAQALNAAREVLKTKPDAKISIEGDNLVHGDPVLRVTTRRYFRTAAEIADRLNITPQEVMEDLHGVVSTKSGQQKFYAGLLKRQGGLENFRRDYIAVMRLTAYQVARSQELSHLRRQLEPVLEQMRKAGYTEAEEDIRTRLDALWGTPHTFSQRIANAVRSIQLPNGTPIGDHIPDIEGLLTSAVSRALKWTNIAYLKFNLRSTAANLMQPWETLWPWFSTSEMVSAYRKALSPSSWAYLRSIGVVTSDSKFTLDEPDLRTQAVRGLSTLRTKGFHGLASDLNKAVGFYLGYHAAREAGMDDNFASRAGQEWARYGEFDMRMVNVGRAWLSPQGRLMLQYRQYTAKWFEAMATISRMQPGLAEGYGVEPDKSFISGPGKRLLKASTARVIGGGVSTLLSPLRLVGIATAMPIYRALAPVIAHALGTDDDDERVQSITTGIVYGLPAAMHTNLSSSLNVVDLPPGDSLTERIALLFSGPTLNLAITFAEKFAPAIGQGHAAIGAAIKDAATGGNLNENFQANSELTSQRLEEAATGVIRRVPLLRQLQVPVRLALGKPVTIPLDRTMEIRVESPIDQALLAMGFAPVAASKYWDLKDSGALEVHPSPRTRIITEAWHRALDLPEWKPPHKLLIENVAITPNEQLPPEIRRTGADAVEVILDDFKWVDWAPGVAQRIGDAEMQAFNSPAWKQMTDYEKRTAINTLRAILSQKFGAELRRKMVKGYEPKGDEETLLASPDDAFVEETLLRILEERGRREGELPVSTFAPSPLVEKGRVRRAPADAPTPEP